MRYFLLIQRTTKEIVIVSRRVCVCVCVVGDKNNEIEYFPSKRRKPHTKIKKIFKRY